MKYVDFELTMKIGNMYHLHVTVYFVLFLHNCCRLILKAQTMFVRMEQLGTFRLRNLWKMKRTESKRKKKRKSKTIPWRYNTAALKCGVPQLITITLQTVELHLMATPFRQWPHIYFILAQTNAQSVIFCKATLWHGHPFNNGRFLWPIGDQINGVLSVVLEVMCRTNILQRLGLRLVLQ